jgi:hypothetical protein
MSIHGIPLLRVDGRNTQHLDDAHIKYFMDSKGISVYSRYLDLIFIINNSSHISLNAILQYAKTIHSKLQLNPNPDNEGADQFLDLTFTKKNKCIEIDTY